jgi:formylglycine-generating enzyme required for sulfatase activity
MLLLLKRTSHKAQFFRERLSNTVSLDMMLISSGTFLMGSSENEIDSATPTLHERNPNQSPQHYVTVPSFCMGKYPITQEQWRVVSNLPQVERELNPEPSEFSGGIRPVEQVSWFDAQEFCARLSKFTKREYRLPSEAEWEYACRAKTTSPFHFGETITTDLANYHGEDYYGRGSIGINREKTTSVGTFPPNVFGLHDMHGNVLEWCLDCYHQDYKGAPTDGSAWIDPDTTNMERIMRGGAWNTFPQFCCSASRAHYIPNIRRASNQGFRIACNIKKTPLL